MYYIGNIRYQHTMTYSPTAADLSLQGSLKVTCPLPRVAMRQLTSSRDPGCLDCDSQAAQLLLEAVALTSGWPSIDRVRANWTKLPFSLFFGPRQVRIDCSQDNLHYADYNTANPTETQLPQSPIITFNSSRKTALNPNIARVVPAEAQVFCGRALEKEVSCMRLYVEHQGHPRHVHTTRGVGEIFKKQHISEASSGLTTV